MLTTLEFKASLPKEVGNAKASCLLLILQEQVRNYNTVSFNHSSASKRKLEETDLLLVCCFSLFL